MPRCILAELHKTGLQATSHPPASCHAKTRPLPMTMQLPDCHQPRFLGQGAPAALRRHRRHCSVLGRQLLSELWGDDQNGLEIPDLVLFSSYRSVPTLICIITASHFLSPRLPAR